MAPPGQTDQETGLAGNEIAPKPINKVLVIVAMQAEASPLVEALKLTPDDGSTFPKGVPWMRHFGIFEGLNVDVVMPGKCPILGVDNVGTLPSALAAYAAIQTLQPDLVINAGTAGGFKAKGACIGDVFVATEAAYHDRRIPIPIFDTYGIGASKMIPVPNLIAALSMKEGNLSTGNSLDMNEHDEEIIKKNDASVKDMEGAAVAYVSNLFSVPAILIKAVTDIIDGGRPTTEEFLENLSTASTSLLSTVVQTLHFVNGKTVSEL